MKIVFVGNTAWGMFNFRRPVLQYLVSLGHEIIVITPCDEDFQGRLHSIGCRCISVHMEAKGSNPLKDIRTMLHIRKVLKEEKADCCFFYTIKPNIFGSFAAASLNIPYITVVTGLGYVFGVNNWISKIAKKLYKQAFKKAIQVWFLNSDDVAVFIREKLVKKEQVYLLNGEGIDLNRFELVHDDTLNISFLLIARMLWDKGIGEYVEAAHILKSKYPEVRFKLLGFLGVDNPAAISQAQMDAWINQGDIEYLGGTDDVRPYINESSCIVLPSYREGVPFTLLEGAASGKPLIAANTVGCKEVVENGINGYLCKVKDAEDLARCMEMIILMPYQERLKMGLKGREKVKREFEISIVIDKYCQALNEMQTYCRRQF